MIEAKNKILQDGDGYLIEINSPKYGTKFAKIGKEDLNAVASYKWHIVFDAKRVAGCQFMVRTNLSGSVLYLHRLIACPNDNMQVDHIDCQPLNNTRNNLRIVSNQENHFNTSSTKGYYWNKSSGKWRAQIRINKKLIDLGLYSLEEDARSAYLIAKEKYHKIQAYAISN